REWVSGKQSIEQLSERSGYSVRHLKSYFYEQLPRCPVWHIQRREKVNLLIDGTYFPNKVCLVLYRDANIKMTVLYRLTDGEHFEELKEDLRNIQATGIEIESVTCDGAPNILKAVREVCKGTILQRCTVHIAMEIETWLTRNPKTDSNLCTLVHQ
ncbi:MAG: transposase, partial [Rikenellaceae bacterium]|nr:transposase [Rikenellaceae bacterium]